MSHDLSRAERRKLRYGPGGTVRFRDLDGTIGITSSDQARAYELAGRGQFDAEGVLVFHASDHRCRAAASSARPRYVNGDGFASLEAIRGLPCIHPSELLMGKYVEHPPRDYPTVEISRTPIA